MISKDEMVLIESLITEFQLALERFTSGCYWLERKINVIILDKKKHTICYLRFRGTNAEVFEALDMTLLLCWEFGD